MCDADSITDQSDVLHGSDSVATAVDLVEKPLVALHDRLLSFDIASIDDHVVGIDVGGHVTLLDSLWRRG